MLLSLDYNLLLYDFNLIKEMLNKPKKKYIFNKNICFITINKKIIVKF